MQCAVETKHHLIVAHDVTNAVHDRHQLSSMAQQAKEALGAEAIEALADRGFYNGKEILACGQAGVTAYVPRSSTSNAKAGGRYDKQDFVTQTKMSIFAPTASAWPIVSPTRRTAKSCGTTGQRPARPVR